MKAKLLKNKKRMMVAAAVLVLLLATGGISAYFTSTDNATNSWTVGDVTIDLLEAEYDKVPETERQNITPNKVFTKDPVVKILEPMTPLSFYGFLYRNRRCELRIRPEPHRLRRYRNCLTIPFIPIGLRFQKTHPLRLRIRMSMRMERKPPAKRW